MLGWQESTLKIHFLELYDAFDNQPCYNLATVSKYKVVPRFCQGCDKVVKKPCAKIVTTLSFLYGYTLVE